MNRWTGRRLAAQLTFLIAVIIIAGTVFVIRSCVRWAKVRGPNAPLVDSLGRTGEVTDTLERASQEVREVGIFGLQTTQALMFAAISNDLNHICISGRGGCVLCGAR